MGLIVLPHPNIFLAFEILNFGTFAVILGREIYQRNAWKVFELVSCVAFGMILEIGNTYLAHTYFYNENFFLQIMGVPLAIGCGWATVIYSAMLLSDQYRIPWTIRPFMDALTVLIIDFSVDAIAIRLKLWTWSIPYNQEWYGVPFENLVGWILVALVFSYTVRFIGTLNPRRVGTQLLMLFSPILEYILLTAGLAMFCLLAILPNQINNWGTLLGFNYQPDFRILYNPEVQLWKLIILVAMVTELVHRVAMGVIKYHRGYLCHFDLVSFLVITCWHVFFLSALLTSGIYHELPYLLFLGGVTFVLHLILHLAPYLIRPGVVYVFHKAEATLKEEERLVKRFVRENFK